MDFDLTPEQELIRDTVRHVRAGARCSPSPRSSTSRARFPYELVAELAELGLMGLPIPEQYGGAGGDTVSYAIAIEELTRVDSSVAITVAAHTSLGTMPILLYGTEEQKERWLPDLASGRGWPRSGSRSPEPARTPATTRTTAELHDGSWVVNGSKIVHHERGNGHHLGRHDHRPDRRGRDLEHRGRERHAAGTRSRRR